MVKLLNVTGNPSAEKAVATNQQWYGTHFSSP